MTELPALPVAARCLALDAVAAHVVAALRDRGIPSVLLKGAGLNQRLATERGYRDVDLLVAPADFDAAEAVLAGLGYRSLLPDARADDWSHWHERTWAVPGPVPLAVDLHRGFAGVGDAVALWWAVRTAAEPLELSGEVVWVPDEAGAALLVALHAACPGDTDAPRADLRRALDVFPVSTWRAAAGVAAVCGASPAYALGLRLEPAGAAVADALGLPGHWSAQQWLAAHQGSGTAYSLARLAGLPTLRARLRHLGVRLLPSPAAMRYASPLARRGALGLTLAYLLRLGRHARRLPGAARELRTARRAAERPSPSSAPAQSPGVPLPPTLMPAPSLPPTVPVPARALRRLTDLGGAGLRLVQRHGPAGLRDAQWAFHACRRVRQQLPGTSLDDVTVPAPPRRPSGRQAAGPPDPAPVLGALRRADANCLERSLVLQRWYAAQGSQRTLVIGVARPSEGFRAHAWLDGEPDPVTASMVELLRRPPPADWLAGPR